MNPRAVATPLAFAVPTASTPTAVASMTATPPASSNTQDISPEDLKEFQAVEFTFGKIPLSEPPSECCIDIQVPIK
jgi:hypothetical protein